MQERPVKGRDSQSFANSNKRLKIDCSEHKNRNKNATIKTFENASSEPIMSVKMSHEQTKKQLLELSSHNETMQTAANTTGINSILVGNKSLAEDLFKSPPDVSMEQSQGCIGQMIMSEVMTYENPTDEMNRRWKLIIEKVLPAIDIIDLSTEHDYFYPKKRQFAPEYSQSSYLTMLSSEFAIGDYISFAEDKLQVKEQARRHMITLLEDLNKSKQYKEETLYLAASLADRYLVNLAVKREKAPCLITLAVISTLMAAKLEQPI